jgi:hypothetical protein
MLIKIVTLEDGTKLNVAFVVFVRPVNKAGQAKIGFANSATSLHVSESDRERITSALYGLESKLELICRGFSK